METALKLEHLNKFFGKRQILHDVSFETYTGEVFGFLGPNGAGKTTTIKMIVGMLRTDDGEISVCGANIKNDFEGALSNIGAIVENPEMYSYMSAYSNLKQYARMRKGVTDNDIARVLDLVGLTNYKSQKVSKFSLGMRQRLGIAQALLHDPKVLILDEPTNGLDPAGIKDLRNLLKYLAHKENKCILVSSHLMSEMELMCDRIGIINNGTILNVTSVADFTTQNTGGLKHYQYYVHNASDAIKLIEGYEAFSADSSNALQLQDETHFTVTLNSSSDTALSIHLLNKLLIENDIELYTVSEQEKRHLEEAFIELTSEGGNQIA